MIVYTIDQSFEMKRKPEEYIKALKLRSQGKSLKKIAKLLGVSVSIVSLWCRNIKLTEEQIEKLKKRKINIRHLRHLAKLSHLEKISRVNKLFKQSKAEIHPLNKQEFFLAGLALYWAEGFKTIKEGRLGFCNTDPTMIRFMLKWFNKILKVKKEELVLRAEFNESHRSRTNEIEAYWSKFTGIPLSQFNKPFYQHSTWKRDYSNKGIYFGVLRIRVRKSGELLNRMRGWISGLSGAV